MAALKGLRPAVLHPVLKTVPAKATLPAAVVATPFRLGLPPVVAMGRRPSFVRPVATVGGPTAVVGDAAVMEAPRVVTAPPGGARTAAVTRAVAPVRANGVALALELATGLPAGPTRVAAALPEPS